MIAIVLGLTSLLWVLPAHSALTVKLEQAELSNEQRQASQKLLEAALKALPPRLVSQLDHEILLRWSPKLAHSVMGRARYDGQILLNQRWLDALVQGDDQTLPAGRQHATLQRELQATLIHELAHFYDRGQFWPADERGLLRSCARQHKSLGPVGLPVECRGQSQRRFTLSDNPRLLELAGWPARIGGRGEVERHNDQYLRTPDAYELSNPREFVAVNLEYFLLDPEYRCRRPGLHDYFSEHFGWAPSVAADCAPGLPYVNGGLDVDKQVLGQLDEGRIYQVHYLLAEPEGALVSRWGHSMLRVVMCAPGRPLGPECLMDLEHHLVLSFRAFVDDLQISSWDGLTGVYPSRLFMLPLSQVVDEYTKVEFRSLQSLPLKLTTEQQISLVRRAAEMHWNYDGTYYFVSNNCAVETLKLLRSGTDRLDIRGMETVTPTGLRALLRHADLLDESVLQDHSEALRQGYYFDSYRERYQLMFDIARERLNLPQQNVEAWLALAPEERSDWFERADYRVAAALLLLEQAAFRRQIILIQHELKDRYVSGRRMDDVALNETGELMSQLLRESGFLSRPAELLKTGYGLPQKQERQQLKQLTDERQQKLHGLAVLVDERALEMISTEHRRAVEANQRNITELGARLRHLHRESGRLVLP
ncbi:DUF7844 domain-containing protein [Halopseudomonas salina]|uniref:DUF7844 domain-containing protein n=1 Tax=Halopseudomonas salina TaxID=1323744 RepID=UPI00123A4E4F|nr:DUF4105 domain-containing protein [Halopseudomonas salina]